MNRIPREQLRHLEWTPGQAPPNLQILTPQPPAASSPFTIDNILGGRTFYSEEKNSAGGYIGVPVALQQTLDYAGNNGIVATMPDFIAAKIKAEKTHDFWKNWYTTHTEENIGIDRRGHWYRRDEAVLVVVHGGGLLTPERILQAYADGLNSGSANYRGDEFAGLLEKKILGGVTLPMYKIEEIQRGISNLPHQFGVVMPYLMAQGTKSGYHKKNEFIANPLALARVGSIENLEKYHNKAKDSDGDVGSWHPFAGRDPQQAQGRVLFLSGICDGLGGGSGLDDWGRFVGVGAGGAT